MGVCMCVGVFVGEFFVTLNVVSPLILSLMKEPLQEENQVAPVQWFKSLKFGILINWGLYSVPAWAPHKK